VSKLVEVWISYNNEKRECMWAMAMATLPGANTVAPRLGSSDCRCPTHLFHLSQRPKPSDFEQLIQTELVIEPVDEAA
jgi:Uri superfamily endonuclease